ncbi:MAG: hypothetical protein KAV41_00360 [Candidatus Pacebacteria bacterium]|nr:hypothetical protein [Candidatus Paceibacterota bacterium]
MPIFRKIKITALLFFFFLPFIITAVSSECIITNIEGKTDAELKIISEQCEKEVWEQKVLLDKKQRESVTIEKAILIADTKITKTDLSIRASKVKIYQIGREINQKEKDILTLAEKADITLGHLAVLVKKTNELDSYSFLEAMLSQETVSAFFIDTNDFEVIKRDLNRTLAELRTIKQQTQDAKESLEESEMNERGLKLVKEKEKKQNTTYKNEKDNLLNLNREQEDEYKATIAEKERVKTAIKNRLFRTVGGVELTFGEALELVQPYEGIISVPAALTLSILSQESGMDGLIGKNQGRCFYNQPAKNKAGTVMSASQKPAFLAILKELGKNPDKTVVSCPIYSDGAYGGAMGPSQFMPRTWWDEASGTGYRNRVANVLKDVLNGRSPSPFENRDAFAGTALYLYDAMERCEKAFNGQFSIWSCTAAKYYSGLYNTTDRTLLKHMRPTYSYGYKVAKRAEQFQRDIDLLNN